MATLAEVIKQSGIRTGIEAMRTSGIQLEFAAHLMLLANNTGSTLILRSGEPPNYNRPISPKPGYIRSKSSKDQGFFNGYLAIEDIFTRLIRDRDGHKSMLGVKPADKIKLEKPITDPAHLHSKQLQVNIFEIYNQLSTDGDLQVKSYDPETGILKLKFRAFKGAPDFKGHFELHLKSDELIETERKYARPWDEPTKEKQEKIKEYLKQNIPGFTTADFERLGNLDIPLFYKETEDSELKPAMVIAKTPRLMSELIQALEAVKHPLLAEIKALTSYQAALDRLGAEELQKVFDQVGRIVTGDWDGLCLGYPTGLDRRYLEPCNTFATGVKQVQEIRRLVNLSIDLLDAYKTEALIRELELKPQTALDKLVLSITDYFELFDADIVQRAGIITPYEFLFQQLANYAYKQPDNLALGDEKVMANLQSAVDFAIAGTMDSKHIWNIQNRAPSVQERQEIINTALAFLDKQEDCLPHILRDKRAQHLIQYLHKILSDPEFTKLKADFAKLVPAKIRVIPHPDFDINSAYLFQHGFDMRSPYGIEADGPWLLVSNEGLILQGNNQQQLIEVLLAENGKLLQNNCLDFNHTLDMRPSMVGLPGWGDVIKKQLELGLFVSEKTQTSLKAFEAIKELEDKYTSKEAPKLSLLDANKLAKVILTYSQHEQKISPSLIKLYLDFAQEKSKYKEMASRISSAGLIFTSSPYTKIFNSLEVLTAHLDSILPKTKELERDIKEIKIKLADLTGKESIDRMDSSKTNPIRNVGVR